MENLNLEIKKLKTKKSKIKSRKLMDENVIPKGISSVIFNGRSGSGKSTLLINLLTRSEFYKDYFDEIYLFCPTAGTDDLFDELKLKKKNIFNKPNEKDLQAILNKQKKDVDKKGVDKAKRVLVILEDIQSCAKFLRSDAVKQSCIANRHYNMSTWICGQSYSLTPRSLRLQANAVFYFKGSGSEKQKILDEYCPSSLTKKQFEQLIDHATHEDYSFLFINMKAPENTRYRKGLSTILRI